jgi:ribonucleoside-triphosphate reductase (formate)
MVSDWRVKENSNSSYSLNGLSNHIATTVQSNYWLKKVYPKKIADAHQSGDIHIHDLRIHFNLLCWLGFERFPFKRVILVCYGKVACKPAKHLHSALDHIEKLACFSLSQEAAGAQASLQFRYLHGSFYSL